MAVIRCLTLCTVLLASAISWAEQPKKKDSEPWYYKLARILGVDRAPVSLKGPAGAKPGELWISAADHVDQRLLAAGTDFKSPVFQPRGKYVFALRGDELVRVSSAGGTAVKVRSLPGVVKLVGFDGSNPDRVLALFETGGSGDARKLDVVLVSVTTAKSQTIAKGRAADSEQMESLLGWQRQYGSIYVRPQGGDIIVGGIQPVDVPVSDCRDAECGQPAYSPELGQVAFIRSGR